MFCNQSIRFFNYLDCCCLKVLHPTQSIIPQMTELLNAASFFLFATFLVLKSAAIGFQTCKKMYLLDMWVPDESEQFHGLYSSQIPSLLYHPYEWASHPATCQAVWIKSLSWRQRMFSLCRTDQDRQPGAWGPHPLMPNKFLASLDNLKVYKLFNLRASLV